MPTEITTERQQVHDLISRLAPRQVVAVRELLEAMLDPVSRAIAKAPIDDEPESEEERRAVAESKEWFRRNPQRIPFEEVLADFGLTLEDIKESEEPHEQHRVE